jgi:hypothetical protein
VVVGNTADVQLTTIGAVKSTWKLENGTNSNIGDAEPRATIPAGGSPRPTAARAAKRVGFVVLG